MNRIKLTNNTDRENAEDGLIPPEAVRSTEIDALVDTGSVELALPEDVVRALGLRVQCEQVVRDAFGRPVKVERVGSVYFEMLGRWMMCSAIVLPEGAQALIGEVQLESMDLVVDPRAQEVRVNPAHSEWTIDLLKCG